MLEVCWVGQKTNPTYFHTPQSRDLNLTSHHSLRLHGFMTVKSNARSGIVRWLENMQNLHAMNTNEQTPSSFTTSIFDNYKKNISLHGKHSSFSLTVHTGWVDSPQAYRANNYHQTPQLFVLFKTTHILLALKDQCARLILCEPVYILEDQYLTKSSGAITQRPNQYKSDSQSHCVQ